MPSGRLSFLGSGLEDAVLMMCFLLVLSWLAVKKRKKKMGKQVGTKDSLLFNTIIQKPPVGLRMLKMRTEEVERTSPNKTRRSHTLDTALILMYPYRVMRSYVLLKV